MISGVFFSYFVLLRSVCDPPGVKSTDLEPDFDKVERYLAENFWNLLFFGMDALLSKCTSDPPCTVLGTFWCLTFKHTPRIRATFHLLGPPPGIVSPPWLFSLRHPNINCNTEISSLGPSCHISKIDALYQYYSFNHTCSSQALLYRSQICPPWRCSSELGCKYPMRSWPVIYYMQRKDCS